MTVELERALRRLATKWGAKLWVGAYGFAPQGLIRKSWARIV